MRLPRCLHFASIAITASWCSSRPRYGAPPADAPLDSIVCPPRLHACMGNRLAWRGIELSDGARSCRPAKRAAT